MTTGGDERIDEHCAAHSSIDTRTNSDSRITVICLLQF
ncbi:hypothetical protein GLA29479_387 [Lysobacter antibioticus]|uniref:Uncharacterized protein n=1 Tax=Lysobacter antibioticus TaxID=84531 RepID=A0A0S2FHW4_LYSAN|nr:hypothetical protein GLA29479_387 [Lysobacter antibioticus]ALN83162.1 hypothetical protein LA76x_5060 [Lysobacter antibioticus]